MARIRAVLRRSNETEPAAPPCVQVGDLQVDYTRREVRLSGAPVHLTPKEFRLLEILISHPGRAFSRLELLEEAFGFNYGGFERTVDVHIMHLRKKIEANPEQPHFVQTVYGFGYKFAEEQPS
jgi:DNA-binding response OmpR family regulator